MRIISQDETVDIDYESSSFFIRTYDDDVAIWAHNDKSDFVMAIYSDLEKAKKILKEMSYNYTRYLIVDNNDYMTMTDTLECELDKPFNKIEIKELKATVYQFPVDEDSLKE